MRLHILSDIHDDYSAPSMGTYDVPADLEADAIIIAGDIAGRISRMGLRWLTRQHLRTGLPIILCAGNHDYWRGSLELEISRFRDRNAFPEGIHILDADELILGGVRFLGGTLWTDYNAYSDRWTAERDALRHMQDFKHIRCFDYQRKLQPHHLAEEHARYRTFLADRLATPFAGPTVVLTHHAPSPRSLIGGRATEPLDASYASDLEDLIRERGPDLWIHGHTHARHDYSIGGTRILCNPRGYNRAAQGRHRPAEVENAGFDPRLIIDTTDTRPLVSAANIEHAYARPDLFQWPFGKAPESRSAEEMAAEMQTFRERASRADPAAALRILDGAPDSENGE
ncbi:phosphatase [Aureimonas endophytica]|uniref:Phosphatase n=1 Tax=Aureimonas endophytica TaxID=2027858 RepID=A0A916ZDK3_9HYPH|nr:metallophosphoesterase [Aureimonas endophytica]GGD87973.1 phosphatase [Aureimonas endophytica]